MQDKYLIWSHEHGAWWGHAHWGYTNEISEAGRYSLKEAQDICLGSWIDCSTCPPGMMIPVPEGM